MCSQFHQTLMQEQNCFRTEQTPEKYHHKDVSVHRDTASDSSQPLFKRHNILFFAIVQAVSIHNPHFPKERRADFGRPVTGLQLTACVKYLSLN
jgi:hypothetical protein